LISGVFDSYANPIAGVPAIMASRQPCSGMLITTSHVDSCVIKSVG
jgi:hypothetical protein